MTTEEGNRMIAIWMGAEIGNPVGEIEVLVNVPDFYSSRMSSSTHATKDLRYHARWDWLMHVVERIQAIEVTPPPNYTGYRIEIVVQGYVKIEGPYPLPKIFKNVSTCGSLINAVWQAVVRFIQLHGSLIK